MSFFDKVGEILSGGLGKGITDIIGKHVQDKDLAARLDADFRTLTVTTTADIEKLRITAEQDAEKEQQETIRAELAQTDLYTKQTRPKLARQAFYLGAAYVGFSVVSKLVAQLPDLEIDWSILTVLIAPELAYMGFRSLDKWKLGK